MQLRGFFTTSFHSFDLESISKFPLVLSYTEPTKVVENLWKLDRLATAGRSTL